MACFTHALQSVIDCGVLVLYCPAMIECPAAMSGRPLPPIQPIFPLTEMTDDIKSFAERMLLMEKLTDELKKLDV